MPSGSRGGGFGGHSGGGGGGRSHGSSSGGHYHSRPVRYRNGRAVHIYRFGRTTYYMPTGTSNRISTLLTFFFIGLFIAFFVGVMFFGEISTVNMIQDDYNYYQEMIDTGYRVDGVPINYYYDDDSEKYYVTYYFYTTDNPYHIYSVKGYTFSVYTKEQAKAIVDSGEIDLVVDENPVTRYADSINLDYGEMPIEQDGAYVQAVKSKNIMLCVLIGVVAIDAVLIISYIFSLRKNLVKDTGEDQEITKNNSMFNEINEETKNPFQQTKKPKKCAYCGSSIKPDQTRCDNCGGSIHS